MEKYQDTKSRERHSISASGDRENTSGTASLEPPEFNLTIGSGAQKDYFLEYLLGPDDKRLSAKEISLARVRIQKIENEKLRGDYFMRLQWKVEFNNQRDSKVKDGEETVEDDNGGICNLTALAMCLEYLGIKNPNPKLEYEDALEIIRQEQGFKERTGAGWEQVADHMGATVEFIINRGAGTNHDQEWWENNVGKGMRSGKAFMFSTNGHILRMQSMDAKGVYVDDPYGKLNIEDTIKDKGQKRKWDELNKREKDDKLSENAGEDNLWEWKYITEYKLHWLASISA